MKGKVSLSKCHPYVRYVARILPSIAEALNITITITSAYRSHEKQKQLYEKYLMGETPYPVARPGTSAHEKGLALDIETSNRAILNQVMSMLGFKWGGPRDPVHYELFLN